MRRKLAILAVLGLVVLAGCSGLPFGGDGADDADAEDPETAEELTLETVEYPDGYNESGVTDTGQALGAHDDAVRDVPGLRIGVHMVATDEGEDGESETSELVMETTVDNEADVEYSETDMPYGTIETYQSGDDATYFRIDDGNEVTYDREDEAAEENRASVANFEEVIANVDFEAQSVEETESATLITYTGDELDDHDGEFDDVESVSVELVVDTDGRVHSLTIAYEVEDEPDYDVEFEFEYDPVTIEEPDWLDEAKEQTS